MTAQPRLISFLLLAGVILAPASVLSQESTCSAYVATALETAEEVCSATGRNQACYGHDFVDVDLQSEYDNVEFERQGDLVNVSQVQNLRLSAMDIEAGVWGISLMRLQASLASNFSARDIMLVLFGNVELANGDIPTTRLPVTVAIDENVNVRVGPTIGTPVSTRLAPGETAFARGRTADSQWLYIEIPEEGSFGWIYAPLITSEDDLDTLEVVELDSARYAPLQAFYLQTDGEAGCGDMPDNGLLVQTPEGVYEVSLWINGVKIRLVDSSTAFMQANAADGMTINLLQGMATIEADGVSYPVVAGTEINIPLNGDMVASGAPQLPTSGSNVNVEVVSASGAIDDFEPVEPFTQDEVEDFQTLIESGGNVCGEGPYPDCQVVDSDPVEEAPVVVAVPNGPGDNANGGNGNPNAGPGNNNAGGNGNPNAGPGNNNAGGNGNSNGGGNSNGNSGGGGGSSNGNGNGGGKKD